MNGAHAKPVLLLLYPGAIAFECMAAVEAVSKHRQTHVATPDGAPHFDHTGLTFSAETTVNKVSVEDYAGCLVPGGNPDPIAEDEDVRSLLRDFDAAGKPLGGICAGVLVLAFAGTLQDRTITHNYRIPWAPPDLIERTTAFWRGATVTDADVQRDTHIITALPKAHLAFAEQFAAAVNDV